MLPLLYMAQQEVRFSRIASFCVHATKLQSCADSPL